MQADAKVGGRAVPIPGGLVIVVTLEIQLDAKAEKISVALRKIRAAITIVSAQINQQSPAACEAQCALRRMLREDAEARSGS